MLKYQDLIDRMTLKEKIRITSGRDNWRTDAMEHLGIPEITLSDGPHGLRHQEEDQDHLGINKSSSSTCFPPACLSAASFDEDLLREMGQAIGFEALCQNVQVVLGPGVNIKRNPLCGRNFEYFSEDPYLASRLGASWIRGLQSMGVGASLKHFALNNQENNRMKSNSIADPKAIRDIYLKAFEYAVKNSRPYTVMGSYNLADGVYVSEDRRLLKDILRDEFGFQGVIMTDWGAMNDKVASFKAGLDLEMPGSLGYFDEDVKNAVESKDLDEGLLDEAVDRILTLVFKTREDRTLKMKEPGSLYKESVDVDRHHELSRRIASESMVLLKNEDHLLPLDRDMGGRLVVIGALANEPRYQGAGSSHINPYKVTSLLDALDEKGIEHLYLEGYALNEQKDSDVLLSQVISLVREEDTVILALGLPETYESEGFDRDHMRLPENQNRLVEALSRQSRRIVVVIYGGSPVEMPWIKAISSLLNAYLPGQAGGEAVYDLLFGRVNPSGRLPETYPIKYEDHVSSEIYGRDNYQVEYREGIYVGYRYFDKAKKNVLFPFGFGLSYTDFSYRELIISAENLDFQKETELNLSFKVKNTGKRSGKEVSQLYIRKKDHEGYLVEKSLKGFRKTALEPGEEAEVTFRLDEEDFLQYDAMKNRNLIYEGEYEILIGSSSREIHLTKSVFMEGESHDQPVLPDFYISLEGKPLKEDFEELLGRGIPGYTLEKPFTLENTLYEMREVRQMKPVIRKILSMLKEASGVESEEDNAYQVVYSMLMHTPIKRLSLVSPEKMPKYLGEVLVHVSNGEYLKAAKKARNRK